MDTRGKRPTKSPERELLVSTVGYWRQKIRASEGKRNAEESWFLKKFPVCLSKRKCIEIVKSLFAIMIKTLCSSHSWLRAKGPQKTYFAERRKHILQTAGKNKPLIPARIDIIVFKQSMTTSIVLATLTTSMILITKNDYQNLFETNNC